MERYKLAGKLSSKLVLVERSNPTYNSVRLQESKLCVAGTQIHVYIWSQAPAIMDLHRWYRVVRRIRRRKIQLADY